MDVGVLKTELAALDSKDRRQVIAFLVALEEKNNDTYRRELARRIDDKEPDHWVSGDKLDQHLGLGGHGD